jgi:putative endonuclease
MYYVYILLSDKDGRLYIGSTPNLKNRLEKHKKGFVLATKNRLPIRLIHYETYFSDRDAKRREVFLKGGKGHDELKVQLQDCFKKVKYKYF